MTGYYKDCKVIIGVPMHHDDSLEDRSDGGPLQVAFASTVEAWKELYGVEYHVEGAMYRGEPPNQFYNPAFVLESKRMNDHFMHPFHGHPFNQFVGVQGASSTNPTTNFTFMSDNVTDITHAVEWTDPFESTVDGIPGFIKRKRKSTKRGVNANPMMSDYVFGRGPCGTGYYHVTTKESYKIMSKRIRARMQQIQNDIAMVYCCSCCASSHPSVLKKEKELRELHEYHVFVKARAKTERPVGEIEMPGYYSISRATAKNQYHHQDFYDRNGHWLFPTVLYNCGGGCGATSASERGGTKKCSVLVLLYVSHRPHHCFEWHCSHY
jgi:hypothetical protein